VDVLPCADGGYDLTVTESTPGGIGQIETIIREMQRQPRSFLDGLEFALDHCPREKTANDLLAVTRAAAREVGGVISVAFEQTRMASGFSGLEAAKNQLHEALQARGFSAQRSFVVSVVNKLLKPATSSTSDDLIFRLNRAWHRRAEKLGISVPARTFAYSCVRHPKAGKFLTKYFEGIGAETPTDPQLFAQVQQLLFETCSDSCPECLNQRGRFYDLGLPSRALSREWLKIEIKTVLISEEFDWLPRAREILRCEGRVRLNAGHDQLQVLVDTLPSLIVEELDLETIRVPVSIARVEQSADSVSIVLHIKDFING